MLANLNALKQLIHLVAAIEFGTEYQSRRGNAGTEQLEDPTISRCLTHAPAE